MANRIYPNFESTQQFDAVVFRFVLLYVTDPVTAVRGLARRLKLGGILMLQEMDMSHAAQVSPSDLFERTVALIPATFAAAGVKRGGWGFADFTNGKPGNEALHNACFPCHQPAKDRDYVFTHYAPTP